MSGRTDRTWSEEGFTLVEMLVVLALMAVVAGASGFALTAGREGRALDAATDRLASDLKRTRIDAIRSGRMRDVRVDVAARRWRRDGAEPVAFPAGLALVLTSAREAGASEAGGTIAFLPNGRSTGGRIDLSAGPLRRSLVVDWLTGTVREGEPSDGVREAAP